MSFLLVYLQETDAINNERPQSAPAAPPPKLSKKQKKDKDKEAKRQEKEQRKSEKEARRRKEEAARQLERMEREAAKLEKLNRSNEKISRSVERVSGRSGSLERRKSRDDSTPVLNQTTVHGKNDSLQNLSIRFESMSLISTGIASPSRRPTIFDVFRPRRGSDPRKREKEALKSAGSDKDSNSSSTGSGSGGLMHSLKVAVQHTGIIGHHKEGHAAAAGKTKASKDGSAHPHQGSHAQVFLVQCLPKVG